MNSPPGSGMKSSLPILLASRWFPVLLIILAGITAYSGSLFVPFAMDDHTIPPLAAGELKNILLHGGVRRVTDLSFALNFRLTGLSLLPLHLTNLVIHLASAVTLYLLIRTTVPALTPPGDESPPVPTFSGDILPLAAALLFVSHPLQTQAVTYLVQRYTLLATLFYLVAVLGYINTRRSYLSGAQRRILWTWGIVTVLAALLALGSKQIAYTLPLMLMVVEYTVFRGGLFNRRFAAICGGILFAAILLALYQWREEGVAGFLFDLRHATAEDTTISRSGYFLTQQRVIVTYLRLLCLPLQQSLFHDYPLSTTVVSPPVLAAMALHLLLLGAAVSLLRVTRGTPAPRDANRCALLRLAALGIIWFYLALAVESSLIPIRDVIFEHRVYLPSCGFFLTLCALAGMVVQEQRRRMVLAGALLAVACLTLISLTIARNRVWSDPLRLWQEAAQAAPNNSLALANLANKYLENSKPDKALFLYVRAFEINPNLAFRPLVDLGRSLQALKFPRERFTTGQEFVLPNGELDFGRYAEWEAVKCNNLGLAFEIMGAPDKARARYEAAVVFRPDYSQAWLNLALLAKSQRDDKLLSRALARLRILNPTVVRLLE